MSPLQWYIPILIGLVLLGVYWWFWPRTPTPGAAISTVYAPDSYWGRVIVILPHRKEKTDATTQ